MRRFAFSLGVVALTAGFLAPSPAAAQQSANFYVGGFTPHSADARGNDDVLFQNGNFLSFDLKHFDGATAGGEWLVELTKNLEAGVGIGIYSRTTPSVYTSFVNSDGSEIQQDLKLRIVPITATVRFLPLGHDGPIQPYIGAGVGVFAWRYSETGQFIDFTDNTISRKSFVGSGANAGPVVLGGVMVGSRQFGVGGEIRYQSAKGTLPTDQPFAGTKIDLGGFNYLAIFRIGF